MKSVGDSHNFKSILGTPEPKIIQRQNIEVSITDMKAYIGLSPIEKLVTNTPSKVESENPKQQICNILLGGASASDKAHLLELFVERQNPSFMEELSKLLSDEAYLLELFVEEQKAAFMWELSSLPDEYNLLYILYDFYAESQIIHNKLEQYKTDITDILCNTIQLHLPNAMKFLVEVGANVKAIAYVRTPLHYAAESGNVEAIKFLVSKGADVNAVTTAYMTPLHYAAESGHVEAIKFLVSKGADVNALMNHITPLHFAARSGNVEAIKFLVIKGADVNAVTTAYMTPLHYAARSGNVEAIKFLVSKGADVKAVAVGGTTLLDRAAQSDNVEAIKFLVSKGADVCSSPTLRYAGNIEVIKFLISLGADVNAVDGAGKTALHCAAESSNVAAVKFLVNKRADVNAVDGAGKTALHYAAESGYAESGEVRDYLVNLGADVNAIDKDFMTPLHYASYSGNVEAMLSLLKYHAFVMDDLREEVAFLQKQDIRLSTTSIEMPQGFEEGLPSTPAEGEYEALGKDGAAVSDWY